MGRARTFVMADSMRDGQRDPMRYGDTFQVCQMYICSKRQINPKSNGIFPAVQVVLTYNNRSILFKKSIFWSFNEF